MSPFPMDESTWKKVDQRLALPPQQTRIVKLILHDKEDAEIAAALHLSIPTVRTYLKRIYDRVGVSKRLALVLRIFAIAQDIGRNGDHHE